MGTYFTAVEGEGRHRDGRHFDQRGRPATGRQQVESAGRQRPGQREDKETLQLVRRGAFGAGDTEGPPPVGPRVGDGGDSQGCGVAPLRRPLLAQRSERSQVQDRRRGADGGEGGTRRSSGWIVPGLAAPVDPGSPSATSVVVRRSTRIMTPVPAVLNGW